ncbi:hypothetical protein CNMCM5793_007445 [Aspergillus hiratsukae]|uniref:Uncharacterized protein n=1 Tax=Aspergillus hiratsukae TaxID=1194566 RepID=A0A8H6PHM7_9EURO|nr:hypothetical protein CNMCM5793_007445 [Aspergillus hiratsukae]
MWIRGSPRTSGNTPEETHEGHPTASTSSLRQAALDQMLLRPWDWAAQAAHMSHGKRDADPEAAPPRNGDASLASAFFCSNIGSSFFAVNPPVDNLMGGRPRPIRLVSESEFTRAHVLQDLQDRQAVVQRARDTIPTRRSATEVCPWLDLTQWPRYVQGHDFTVIAQLSSLPEPTTEPLRATWADSIQRLVARACNSVHERKINDFDLIRINSILYRSRAWDRPLLVDLKETTYQRTTASSRAPPPSFNPCPVNVAGPDGPSWKDIAGTGTRAVCGLLPAVHPAWGYIIIIHSV